MFFSDVIIEGGAKVDIVICRLQCLFLYFYLLITVITFHMNNCKPSFSQICI